MRWFPDSLRAFLAGPPKLEEESYPRDALGRPDLQRFTKPISHYTGYLDEYLEALVSAVDPAHQSFAYRKGVLGQWGLIAKGPTEGLPYVLRLMRHSVPEGRSAAAGILDAWSTDRSLIPHLIDALAREQDTETLSTLIGTLGRLKVATALPRLAALLRSPDSDHGDLSWSVIEAVSAIAGVRFTAKADPRGSTDEWLRQHGY